MVLIMMQQQLSSFARFPACLVLPIVIVLSAAPAGWAVEPSQAAVEAFQKYAGTVEARLTAQHASKGSFLAPVASQDAAKLQNGDMVIEQVNPPRAPDLPGALIYHWRGAAFAPGARAADFDRIMRDFAGYPRVYSPEVERARVLSQNGDRYQVSMRVRQRHVITVVMDTSYDVMFARRDAQHGYSISRSTRIVEIDSPGTPSEQALSPKEEHGFLWRLNTYWSYEERDGGLYMQIESISLTRSIPAGLGWAIGPFVESVPRESLEFTLRTTRNALRR
jgi:hypothetical protein